MNTRFGLAVGKLASAVQQIHGLCHALGSKVEAQQGQGTNDAEIVVEAEYRRTLAELDIAIQTLAPAREEVASATRTLEHLKVVLEKETEAVTRFLDQRCVGVLGMKAGVPDEIGSGTCVLVGGRYFIATAAHVIMDFAIADIFLIHTRTPSNVQTPILAKGIRGGRADDDLDVGYLELSSETAVRLGKTFVPLSQFQLRTSHLPDDNAIVYGYPGEKIDPELLKKQQLQAQPIGYLTPTIAPDSLGKPPDLDIYLEYPAKGNLIAGGQQLDKIPAAPGISGGGIWTAESNRAGVWAPQYCKLIAVEHSWRPYEWVRGNQIDHWLALIYDDYADTRAAIDEFRTPAVG